MTMDTLTAIGRTVLGTWFSIDGRSRKLIARFGLLALVLSVTHSVFAAMALWACLDWLLEMN